MQVNLNAQFVNRAPAKKAAYQHTPSDSSLRGMLDRANVSLVEYRSRINAMQRRIAELEKGAAGQNVAPAGDDAVRKAEERFLALKEQLDEAEALLRVEKDGRASVRRDLDRVSREADEVKKELCAAKEENEGLRNRVKDLESENSTLKASLEKAVDKLRKRKANKKPEDAGQSVETPVEQTPALDEQR